MSTEASTTTPGVAAGTWTIDPTHSQIRFTVHQLMMPKARGHFEKFEGTLTTGDKLTDTTAEARIDLASVNTRNPRRDRHLRSRDFFDVENDGLATFRSTSFDGSNAKGELTIKGVTNAVDLDVTFLGIERDVHGDARISFKASTEINRKEFGVDFDIPLVGKLFVGHKAKVDVSVQAILKA